MVFVSIFARMNDNIRHKWLAEEMERLSVGEFKQAPKLPVCLIVDSVRSLHNVGSFLRSADAFRIEKVFLCGICGCPPHADIHKTALGAEDSVEWEYAAEVSDVITHLHEQGWLVCAIEQVEHSIALQDFPFDNKARYALIVGNEVMGVSQKAVDMADCCIEIPQYGTKHSLNVSVSAGILLWEFARRFEYSRLLKE